jgi:hypothetical protein
MILLKEFLEGLNNIVKANPQALDFQVIYSHDDEGNEYQRVVNLPSEITLENPNQKSYRFLEITEENEFTNAIIIN